ncbi:hypothetical protein C8R43DRAFT_956002 [Mycena crocata]|nr:hypothetical protein C8R43DRAFT_956002 [Mycena crocata]
MPFKRTRDNSDYDPNYAPPPTKQPKLQIAVPRTQSLPPSSPPPPLTPDEEIDTFEAATPMQDIERSPTMLAPLPSLLFTVPANAEASSSGLPQTPGRAPAPLRAMSLEPRASSPMSTVDVSPLKPKHKLGRPAYSPDTRVLKRTLKQFSSSQRTPDQRKVSAAVSELQRKEEQKLKDRATAKAEEKRLAAQRKAEKDAAIQAILDAEKTRRAQEVIALITKSDADGGFNFANLEEFFDALWRKGGDAAISSKITQYIQRHGTEHVEGMFKRSKEAKDEYISGVMEEIFQREGRAIQKILTRDSTTTVTDLLKEFSMDKLADEIEAAAPMLWAALAVLATPDQATRREADGENRRNKGLVFTTICALISVMRSQKANNLQLVIGLFLLGSGASKREISVLAHAGLSISYQGIIDHVKKLSSEGLANIRELVKSCMVQVVWDNLNIAFKVAEQRLKAKTHFDNGTTATVIKLSDPSTGGDVPHGTLPLEMKPPRERTLPVLDWSPEDTLPSAESAAQLSDSCFWQMKRLALEHIPGVSDELKKSLGECPEVNQIPLHTSNQHPLPAMQDDESTLDGTLQLEAISLLTFSLCLVWPCDLVIQKTTLTTCRIAAADSLKYLGHILLYSGDYLMAARRNSTTPIAGLQASCRRWGLFHGQMAGGRLTVNEHWGAPNSLWPGGLWWEHNKLLKRKPLSAGWGGPKATEWKPAHELIHISLPAHIVDGFRIYCGQESLPEWAKSATPDEFEHVARTVFDNLFSTGALNELRARKVRDTTVENAILYNRDALFYVEFVHAIKKGDIGRVLNVLSIWMVMMRSPKTMPRYADAMFETLVRIKNFPPKLRNIKTSGPKSSYAAKGTNKSWKWLSMITVCIFTIREAMCTVQTSFKIPAYGEKHKSPPITEEVALIAQALQDEKIQSYVEHRPANDHVAPVRDLIREGALYANTRKAFHRFTRDTRKPEKRGFERDEAGDQMTGDNENEQEGEAENYDPTEDDLRVDDEGDGPYGWTR